MVLRVQRWLSCVDERENKASRQDCVARLGPKTWSFCGEICSRLCCIFLRLSTRSRTPGRSIIFSFCDEFSKWLLLGNIALSF